jgi:uncharacterized protein
MDYPTFDPKSPDTPLSEEELAALDAALEGLPADGAMTLDGLDGYLTALLVGPPLLDARASADWLPAVWGGDPEAGQPAPFASNQKKKRTTVLVLRHLRSILASLERDAAAWEPVFSVAQAAGAAAEELADAGDWCRGFLAATDLDLAAWAPLFDDGEAIGAGLATIRLLGEHEPGTGEGDLDDPVVRDGLSRDVMDAVLALWARRIPTAASST